MSLLSVVLNSEGGRRAQLLPTSFTARDLRWHKNLDVLRDFHRGTSRLPSQHAQDASERFIGKWLATQRAASKGRRGSDWSEARQDALDQSVPGWDVRRDSEAEWRERFESLRLFREVNGRMPNSGETIYAWLATQRVALRDGSLSAMRIQTLAELDSEWHVSETENRWLESYRELTAFFDLNGRLPLQGRNPKETVMQGWCRTQRNAYAAGRLPTTKVSLLDSGLPGWRVGRDDEGRWDRRFAELETFYRREGRWPRSSIIGPDNEEERNLGRWLANQKSSFHGKGTVRMTEDRVSRLDSLSPEWRGKPRGTLGRKADTWEDSFEMTREFYLARGSWPSAAADSPHERKLGRWIVAQRQVYRGNMPGNVTPEREALLSSLSPDWHERFARGEEAWNRHAASLRGLHDENVWPANRLDASEESKLADWLSRQKVALKAGTLPASRRAVLDSITVDWPTRRGKRRPHIT